MKRPSIWISVALATVALGAMPLAHAWGNKPLLLWCQHCTAAQRQQAAMSQSVGNIVYVGDPTQQTVSVYLVTTEHGQTPSHPSRNAKIAQEFTPDPGLVKGLKIVMDFYNVAPVGWHKHSSVRIDSKLYGGSTHPVSAYDVATYGRTQNIFTNRMDELSVSKPELGAMKLTGTSQVLAAFRLVDSAAKPAWTIKLEFDDGSSMEAAVGEISTDANVHVLPQGGFKRTPGKPRGKLMLEPSTAQDSHHNEIAYIDSEGNVNDLGGDHDFDPSTGNAHDLPHFLNQLSRFQIPVYSSNDASGGADQAHERSCTLKRTGKKASYRCQHDSVGRVGGA